jgi:hypothetical protein
MCAGLPDVAADLVELAAFVYAADQAITRGGTAEFEYGERWRRHFRFEVPVRCPAVWGRRDVLEALAGTLGFLSDDDYEFAFTQHSNPPSLDRYLFDQTGVESVGNFEEVVLFSGGQDSLCGAVREVLQGRRKVALVSHRPVNIIYRRQCALVAEITRILQDSRLSPLHVAVEVNKGGRLDREHTQRTRSFLFAAVAAVVAWTFGLRRIRFYENGVISLNLPISPQVLGGRASRTTHPRALKGFEQLFTCVFGERVAVENPCLWETRAQMMEQVRAAGYGRLIGMTGSCTHTRRQRTAHPHCGLCSQCLDRRVSALVAGLTDNEDPPQGYTFDVLTGPREGADLILAESYVRVLREIRRIPDARAFVTRFPEVARVLPYLDLPAERGAELIFDLHHQHAHRASEALERVLQRESTAVLHCTHPVNSLFGVLCGRSARRPPAGAATPPSNGQGQSQVLELDDERFEARWAGNVCFLGNTLEYRLLVRLSLRPGFYVSVNTLRRDVWRDDCVEKNTIQRVASTLRKRLRGSNIREVQIDGDQKDHYRLLLPVGGTLRCQRNVSDPANET